MSNKKKYHHNKEKSELTETKVAERLNQKLGKRVNKY